jgi:glycosyltransferase involved in cell wall biosynthesis
VLILPHRLSNLKASEISLLDGISMLDVSVIICAHNPRPKSLERTLGSLRAQTLSNQKWELIVIDNASAEPIADNWDLSWHSSARHVLEPELGLSSARQRGMQESQGDLLVFVDDDNVLAPDYLSEALRIENDYHFLGVWGSGSIDPEFEVEPANHLKSLLPWLGLRHVEQPVWSNVISTSDATPIGAGLCVRRKVGQAYIDFCKATAIKIPGRKGASLGGHEDFEICYLSCKAGMGMGMFPQLKMLHLIAKERVTDEYFLRLVESLTLSNLMLAYKWNGTLPKSWFSLRGVTSSVLNILTRRGFDRQVYFAEQRAVVAARRMFA